MSTSGAGSRPIACPPQEGQGRSRYFSPSHPAAPGQHVLTLACTAIRVEPVASVAAALVPPRGVGTHLLAAWGVGTVVDVCRIHAGAYWHHGYTYTLPRPHSNNPRNPAYMPLHRPTGPHVNLFTTACILHAIIYTGIEPHTPGRNHTYL